MDSKVILEGIRPDVLGLLHQGQIASVLSEIEPKPKSFFDFFRKSKKETHFAYDILPYCINKTLNPTEYSKVSKLDFASDFSNELTELYRVLLVLQDYAKEPEIEKLIAQTLLEVIRDGAAYMAKNSTSAKIWMNGLGLQTKAGELSEYFKRKSNDQNVLAALYLKAQLTNTIMGHYPYLVGPDMIAVAMQYEKMGNIERAKDFFNPVVLDFTPLVQGAQKWLAENEAMVEDILITESLISALEGLKRLGEDIDEDALHNSKEILKELKKATTEDGN